MGELAVVAHFRELDDATVVAMERLEGGGGSGGGVYPLFATGRGEMERGHLLDEDLLDGGGGLELVPEGVEEPVKRSRGSLGRTRD